MRAVTDPVLLLMWAMALLRCTSQSPEPATPARSLKPGPPRGVATGADAACQASLLTDPAQIPADFSWRQLVSVEAAAKRVQFEVVLQKHQQRLVLMALSPAHTPLFTLEQIVREVRLQWATGHPEYGEEAFPVEPLEVLADVHRALFLGLLQEATPRRRGLSERCLAGERVRDDWGEAGLLRRDFYDPADRLLLRIEYRPPYVPGSPPGKIVLAHTRPRYTITIETFSAP